MNLKKLHSKETESGQVLLIIVMLLATVLTIVMTTSLTTATQTQLTKDQEDSVKARAAAESALELALAEAVGANKTFDQYIAQNPNLAEIFQGINTAESYIQVEGVSANTFVSPVIESDRQYTFYFAYYTGGTFSSTNFFDSNGTTLKVYYGNSSSSDCADMVTEFTIISGTRPYTVTRYIAGSTTKIGNDEGEIGEPLGNVKKFDGNDTNFYCVATFPTPLPGNLKLLILRPLYDDTRFGFESTGDKLPAQGKTVKAVAKSNTGVTKIVQLFQSYPQIPANMFITSF